MLAQALVIGMLGTATTFGPLIADVSHWFKKRRGIAVAIVASGSYVAGTIWPPILQHAIDAWGWRQTYVGVGIFCVLTMLPLALCLRRRAKVDDGTVPMSARDMADTLRMSPATLQVLLVIAGLACCIAMSMPQVHIVAYCADLGYGPARGAEMLSLMLGFGVVSRLVSGLIADRIGGLGTLLLGSSLQCLALLFYLPFDGLTPLYIVSALFGLSQGGIVPSYALIVRDYFPAREAGARVSLVLMATIVGMAVGGWLSGAIYDLTGSYQAAFLNGIAWNLLNMSIAFWLLLGALPAAPARRRDSAGLGRAEGGSPGSSPGPISPPSRSRTMRPCGPNASGRYVLRIFSPNSKMSQTITAVNSTMPSDNCQSLRPPSTSSGLATSPARSFAMAKAPPLTAKRRL